MLRKLLSMQFVLLLFIFLLPATILAADKASFSLTIANDKPQSGKEVQITVKGENLQDVYAFEVNFIYDPNQLKLKTAKSAIPGFSVPPIVKKDHIQFAHTKTGSVAGESGNVTLCTLTFEAIGKGEAAVQMTNVKLVTSSLTSSEQMADTQIIASIQDGKKVPAFSDISGHWAKAAIERAAKMGFVNGYDDGTFRPQGQVTRAEFAVMLAGALNLQMKEGEQLVFADLDRIPVWARPSIVAAVTAGIITGYEDHSYRADKLISRAEITTMIVKALGITADAKKVSAFADSKQIPEWAQPYVAAAAEAGLIQGRGANTFAPKDHATRAEAVNLILNMLDKKG
jgi:hypothetical protein